MKKSRVIVKRILSVLLIGVLCACIIPFNMFAVDEAGQPGTYRVLISNVEEFGGYMVEGSSVEIAKIIDGGVIDFVENWVSTTKPYVMNLSPGQYVLKESKVADGYKGLGEEIVVGFIVQEIGAEEYEMFIAGATGDIDGKLLFEGNTIEILNENISGNANPAPVTPADPAPVTPADPAPVTPADPAPVTPADPAPVTPADPAPVTPADPAPVTPADPGNEIEIVPEDIPGGGVDYDTVSRSGDGEGRLPNTAGLTPSALYLFGALSMISGALIGWKTED